jgi:hypothetical protein
MAYGDDNVVSANLATAGFVPDIWVDEIMAAHKKNLVLASQVRKVNVKGKKGDSVTLPRPTRGVAVAKVADTLVTTQTAAGTGIGVALTSHWEYSRLIEDIAETHALSSMRRFYTDDAGYALGRAKDNALFVAAYGLNGGTSLSGTWASAVIAGDGTTAYVDAAGNANATAITDAGIRRVIQFIDDNDLPMNDRYLVVPPVGRRVMMGLARFTEQAFKGDGSTIKNGKLGDVYGVSVHVSSNCPAPTAGTTVKIGILAHKDALVLCDVLGPRVQTQYKQEYLATLLTADTIFGSTAAYASGGLAIAMPNA